MTELNDPELIDGKYVVERVLGSGGMGRVLAARHAKLGHRVAIKVIQSTISRSPDLVVRLVREGQAAARLRSEHSAKVLDVGELEGGWPYLVMEYLEGMDLSALIAHNGPIPLERAVDYILQASEAVAEAHAVGIVHRDLKPANLFLATDAYGSPTIKVLDFGISKLAEPSTANVAVSSLTKTATVMGSPLYMAPEQMRSARQADERSDIWAFGATLYELLTGECAWSATTLQEVCMKVAVDPAPRASDRVGDLPEAIDLVIARAMSKDPAQRFQSVAEFAASLVPWGGQTATHRLAQIERLSGRIGTDAAVGDRFAETMELQPSQLVGGVPPTTARDEALTGGTSRAWGNTKQREPVADVPLNAFPVRAAVFGGLALLAAGGAVFWGLRSKPPTDVSPAAAPARSSPPSAERPPPIPSSSANPIVSPPTPVVSISTDAGADASTDAEADALTERSPTEARGARTTPAPSPRRRATPTRVPRPRSPTSPQPNSPSVPDWGGRE
ncbi:MAG: protein kinase [Polyangiaceae bacterium]|nr:protein kinase [Polyangiaceae bacterium]